MTEAAPKEYTLSETEMSLVLNMIAVVSKRGGFLPTEFKLVGEFWEKFAPKDVPPPDEQTPAPDSS